MSAEGICLYDIPLFYANLTPNDHVFHYSPHRMTPLFQNFNVKLQKFFTRFSGISNFWKFTPKKAIFFFWIPHPMTPFLLRNPTPNAPCFRSPVGTYMSLSCSSAPPRPFPFPFKAYIIFAISYLLYHINNHE